MSEMLENRMLVFSKALINITKETTVTLSNRNVIEQLLRSATSIGANYQEACGAVSKKDFISKLAIARKEAKETFYWLQLLEESQKTAEVAKLRQECHEFVLILSKSLKSSQQPT